MADYIDAMAGPGVPQVSRWDRGDGATAIAALDQAMAKAGLPDRLEPATRLLAQGEQLFEQAREEKRAAADRLEQATRALLTAGPGAAAAAYGQVLVEVGPWLGDQPAAMAGVMNAGHRAQANATQTTFAMAHGLYRELGQVCAEAVAEVAAVPALPREVWLSTTGGQAAEAAIRAGHELAWSRLVKANARWDAVHAAAALLRETGVFQADLLFPAGCPTMEGCQFLNWEPAVEQLPQVRRLPATLRLRACVDRGWQPGLWLKADHDAYRAATAPRPGLLARLGVGSGPKAEQPVEVG